MQFITKNNKSWNHINASIHSRAQSPTTETTCQTIRPWLVIYEERNAVDGRWPHEPSPVHCGSKNRCRSSWLKYGFQRHRRYATLWGKQAAARWRSISGKGIPQHRTHLHRHRRKNHWLKRGVLQFFTVNMPCHIRENYLIWGDRSIRLHEVIIPSPESTIVEQIHKVASNTLR